LRRAAAALLALALAASVRAAAEQSAMVVYLPSVANQNPQQVAAAATSLASELSSVAGGPIDVSFFKRAEDALEFLSTNRARVSFVLCDAAFLQDLPGDELEPLFRFTSGGSERERKLVVVRANGAKRFLDLKGKTLAAVPVPSKSFAASLGHLLDDVVPSGFFGRIEPVQDEFAATAALLYGGADAALVSDQNPLAAGKLGSELRVLFTSAPVSQPVLAARRTLARFEEPLGKRLAELPSKQEGRAILQGLHVDGFRPIADPAERAALSRPPARRARPLEVAVPDASLVAVLADAPAPSARDLPFVAALPMPDIPIAKDAPAPR
jgi:ABC-type phosphate/phosphonate transport system substrate-binding protein